MTEESTTDDVYEHILPTFYAEGSLRIACPDNKTAHVVMGELALGVDEQDALEMELSPICDEDSAIPTVFEVTARQVVYDRDTGWWSTDLPEEYTFDLREQSGE